MSCYFGGTGIYQDIYDHYTLILPYDGSKAYTEKIETFRCMDKFYNDFCFTDFDRIVDDKDNLLQPLKDFFDKNPMKQEEDRTFLNRLFDEWSVLCIEEEDLTDIIERMMDDVLFWLFDTRKKKKKEKRKLNVRFDDKTKIKDGGPPLKMSQQELMAIWANNMFFSNESINTYR